MQVPRCSSSSSHHDSSTPDVVRCGFLLAHSCCAVREFCARCSVATFGIMCTITNLDTIQYWAKGIPRALLGHGIFHSPFRPWNVTGDLCFQGRCGCRQCPRVWEWQALAEGVWLWEDSDGLFHR